MTPEEKRELTEAVQTAVVAAMEKAGCVCACKLTEDAQGDMGHLVGMLRDMGVEEVRDDLKAVRKWRWAAERVGMAVIVCVAVTMTGGLLALVWHALAKGKGGS